jgi:hypothetical protein
MLKTSCVIINFPQQLWIQPSARWDPIYGLRGIQLPEKYKYENFNVSSVRWMQLQIYLRGNWICLRILRPLPVYENRLRWITKFSGCLQIISFRVAARTSLQWSQRLDGNRKGQLNLNMCTFCVLASVLAGLEFPWNQLTAMALKIAVERITAVYGNFGSFHGIFSNYCNKNLILLLLWIVDKLETCLLYKHKCYIEFLATEKNRI